MFIEFIKRGSLVLSSLFLGVVVWAASLYLIDHLGFERHYNSMVVIVTCLCGIVLIYKMGVSNWFRVPLMVMMMMTTVIPFYKIYNWTQTTTEVTEQKEKPTGEMPKKLSVAIGRYVEEKHGVIKIKPIDEQRIDGIGSMYLSFEKMNIKRWNHNVSVRDSSVVVIYIDEGKIIEQAIGKKNKTAYRGYMTEMELHVFEQRSPEYGVKYFCYHNKTGERIEDVPMVLGNNGDVAAAVRFGSVVGDLELRLNVWSTDDFSSIYSDGISSLEYVEDEKRVGYVIGDVLCDWERLRFVILDLEANERIEVMLPIGEK